MNRILKSAVLAVTLAWVGSASAFMIGGVDVGGADTLLDEIEDLNKNPTGCGNGNSESVELCWINSVLAGLGESSTIYGPKVETQPYALVDGSSTVIGFELSSPTEYFFIKNSTWYGLFRNTSELDWAVVDIAAISSGFNLPDDDEYTISHIAPIGGIVEVPEPGTIALLGLGLFAMGFRRKFVKS